MIRRHQLLRRFAHLLLFTLRYSSTASFERRMRQEGGLKMMMAWRSHRGTTTSHCFKTTETNNNASIRGMTTTTSNIHSAEESKDGWKGTRASSSLLDQQRSLPFSKYGGLVASRVGLDPASNRFHAPFVYHENYSFHDWPKGYTFPVRNCKKEEGRKHLLLYC